MDLEKEGHGPGVRAASGLERHIARRIQALATSDTALSDVCGGGGHKAILNGPHGACSEKKVEMTYPSIRSPIRRAFSEEELVLFFVLLSPPAPGYHSEPATADGMLHMLNTLEIPGAFERVAAALADLVKSGLIERGEAVHGHNTYRITDAGRAAAARIDLAEIAWRLLPKWPIGAMTPPVSIETAGRKLPVVRIGQIPFWELRSLVLGLGTAASPGSSR